MEIINIQDIAYEMQDAYKKTKNQKDAIDKVLWNNPDIDPNILCGMWAAIDAYEDMRG